MLQITLNQTEIENAIKAYLQNLLVFADGTDIRIDMKATRGAEGFSATIDVNSGSEEQALIEQQEKDRITKAKEATLEKAGRFLNSTAETARAARAKSEPEQAVVTTEEEENLVDSDEPEETQPTIEKSPAPAEPKKTSIFKNTVAPK